MIECLNVLVVGGAKRETSLSSTSAHCLIGACFLTTKSGKHMHLLILYGTMYVESWSPLLIESTTL